jgi:DNA-binding NarL/FixJ family response regulator
MVRILVCEDDGRFRRLLVKLLSAVEGFEVAGEAGSGEQACDLVRSLVPDLLLLDLELPGIGGMEVIERLHLDVTDETPEILVLTTFSDEDKLFEAMRRGAAGYLVKGLASSKLESAIREVMAGGTVIEARLARRFWSYFASERGRSDEGYGLTEEELWVLTLVGRGLTNPEAAAVIGSSRRAVKSRLARIYRKLGVSSRVEATVKALRAGLIEL